MSNPFTLSFGKEPTEFISRLTQTNEIVEDDSLGLLIDLTRDLAEGEPTDTIEIIGADQAQMSFTVPEDARSGDTIHMIAEVQDDGTHTLKHYQRVVITVE